MRLLPFLPIEEVIRLIVSELQQICDKTLKDQSVTLQSLQVKKYRDTMHKYSYSSMCIIVKFLLRCNTEQVIVKFKFHWVLECEMKCILSSQQGKD